MRTRWIAGLLLVISLNWASTVVLPAEALMVAASPAMPCGHPHHCCISRAPVAPASLPQRTEVSPSGFHPSEKIVISRVLAAEWNPEFVPILDTSQAYLDLSMVLRN